MNSHRRKFIKSLLCFIATLPVLGFLKPSKKDISIGKNCAIEWNFESKLLSFNENPDNSFVVGKPLSASGQYYLDRDFSVHAWIKPNNSDWQEIKTTLDKWNEMIIGFDGTIDSIAVYRI